MRLPGVGAKTTRRLLRRARHHHARRPAAWPARRAACARSKGLGAKAEEKILAAIAAGGGAAQGRDPARPRAASGPTSCWRACARTRPASRPREAGSLRRRRETVGDIDLIAASDEAAAAAATAFCELPRVAEVDRRAATRRPSIVTHDGIQVDLRVVPPGVVRQPPAALHGLEGAQRRDARGGRGSAACQGLRVGHREVESRRGAPHGRRGRGVRASSATRRSRPSCASTAASSSWRARARCPRLRRARRHARRPAHAHRRLRRARDDRGDGGGGDGARATSTSRSPTTRAASAWASASSRTAPGARRARSASTRPTLAPRGFVLLAGVEVDVMADGGARLPGRGAGASSTGSSRRVHGGRAVGPRPACTARLVAAAEHPHVDVIGHPSGRMLGRREAYDFDVEAVIAACAEHGTFLEINANPRRLDLKPASTCAWRSTRGRPHPRQHGRPPHTTLGLMPSGWRWRAAAGRRRGRREHASLGGVPGPDEAVAR